MLYSWFNSGKARQLVRNFSIRLMPLPLYFVCFALAFGGLWCWRGRHAGWGVPACMVLATVSVWYVGDIVYNDLNLYLSTIGSASIDIALWQVLIFIITFVGLVQPVHKSVNGKLLEKSSYAMALYESNLLSDQDLQARIDLFGRFLLLSWMGLMGVALLRVQGDVVSLFAPYMGQRAEPWARGQIGGGASALISLGAYLHIFLTASFGVLAALAKNRRTRNTALMVCFLAFPFFIFDRTRNAMLAVVLPGILAFVFFRLRSGLLTKGLMLAGCFLLIEFWFSTVMANRSGMNFDIRGALSAKSNPVHDENPRHDGLNMLEELAWIDHFMETGAYEPNWGHRYFAELVNPIPRGVWKNKPTIGLDYAVARGQNATGPNGEVTATVSTGMIGQGVVNFGRILGPMASAVLMSLWVALLARQDLLGTSPGRMILYGVGLILTFNMGRDITLLVLYPFFLGLVLFKISQFFQKSSVVTKSSSVPRRVQTADVRDVAVRKIPGRMGSIRRRS
jgi:hypothetical protein